MRAQLLRWIAPVLLALVLSAPQAKAQSSSELDKLLSDASDLVTAGKLTEAREIYYKAIVMAKIDSIKLSDYRLGVIHYLIYTCSTNDKDVTFLLNELDSARKYFLLSGYNEYAGEVHDAISSYHVNILKNNWTYDVPLVKNRNVSTVTHDYYYKVSEIYLNQGDTIPFKLMAGTLDGLREGMAGYYRTVKMSNDDDFDRLDMSIGEVTLTACYPNYSYGYVIRKTDSVWYMNPVAGDVVQFRIKVPATVYPGIIYKLGRNYSLFRGINKGVNYYHPRDLARNSSKALEDQLFEHIAAKVSSEVRDIAKTLSPDSTFTKPFTKGRFKDSTLLGLLMNCKPQYIKQYLCYASDYPGSYRGDNQSVAELLATWMLRYAPYSSTDLLYTLKDEKDTSKVRKLVFENIEYMHIDTADFDDYLHDWFNIAQNLSKYGRYAEARDMDSFTFRIAEILNIPAKMGYAWFTIAYNRANEDLYKDAIVAYQKAIPYMIQSKAFNGVALVYNNIGNAYENLNQYTLAIQNYKLAVQYKINLRKQDSTKITVGNIAKSYLGIGNCYYNISRYDSAVHYYKLGADFAKRSKELSVKSDLALLYHWCGRSYEKTGDYGKALLYYDLEIPIRKQTGDEVNLAEAYDYLAYAYSQIGDHDQAIDKYVSAYHIKMKLGNPKGAGFSLSNVAQSFYSKDLYDTAITLHKRAIKLRIEGGDSAGVAYCSKKLGSLFSQIGDPKQALEYLLASYQQYKRLEPDDDNYSVTKNELASVMSDLADAYYNLKDYTTAINIYEGARDLYLLDSNKNNQAIALYNIGLCHYNLKNYKDALRIQTESYNIRKNIDDKPGMIRCLNELSVIAIFMERDFPRAEKYVKDALKLARITNSQTQLAYAYGNLGILYSTMGKINLSNKYYDSSIYMYEYTGSISEACVMKNYKGFNEMNQGHFERSREIFLETLDSARKIGNNTRIADSYSALCDYYNLMGEFQTALSLLDSTMELYTSLDNKWGVAGAYITYGNIYNSMGQYRKTMEYYNLSDSMYAILGDSLSRGTPINNMGTIYYFQGDYKNALRCFYSVYGTLKRIDYKGEFLSTVLWNVGEVYLEDKIFPEAEKWLNDAMKVAIANNSLRKKAGVSFSLGKLRLEQQKYKEADSLLNFAHRTFVKINELDNILESANSLGKLYYRTNNYEKALQYLNISIQRSHKTGSFKFLWEPLYLSAKIYSARGDIKTSSAKLKEAVEVIEMLKSNLAGNETSTKLFAKAGEKVKIYELLVAQLIEQNETSLAFYYLEMANVEGLKDQTRGNNDTRGGSAAGLGNQAAGEIKVKINGLYAQLVKERAKPEAEQNKEKIKSLEDLMSVAKENYRHYVDSIVKASPEAVTQFASTIEPSKLDQARFELPDEIAVVEYLATANQVVIFVATNNSLTARSIEISKAEIERAVATYYLQLKNKSDITVVQKNSEILYNLLVAPIKSLIGEKTKLALVPTGIFYKLPFGSLGTTQNGKFHYMLEDFELYYINDIRFVENQGSGLKGDIRAVAFGNCDNTLPFAEEEVKAIKEIFSNTDVYIKENATEDLAKTLMLQYPIVHFATHGNLDPVIFGNSYLTMAPNVSKGEDGRFTMTEISKFESLRSINLIVLSACNTAVNEEKVEGWINNPAKEFINKGVKSAIATLWSVDDQATGAVLKHFYGDLKNNKCKSESLKAAQIKVMKEEKFSHPYYWAAFELIGQWK